jgi:hypothetical protein
LTSKGFSVSRISFQNEQPSEFDVFPGGSHDKVATAMCDYITDEKNSRVLGLDGEFGSGKSSILTMLQQKLVKVDQKYKVWFFDCEQNYQGSIKSNFIELFTEELLEKVGPDVKARDSLRDSRDRALGRQFTYTKNTISRVSSWALILVIALFFSTSSFKELFALTKLEDPKIAWLVVHIFSFVSPLIVLLVAHWKLKDTKVGDQPWSIYHLFKGGSDDTITEKIKVAKEVTPLDLKRTLDDDLKLVADLHYVVILDNLDRLPKDSLRAVWSDLEIFTGVTEKNNLTVIVPSCTNKVAKYLAPESDRTYDSRDFIAKKFPVVFRAPPIIAAGWKDGFYQLWQSTFPSYGREIAEKCALLLQRHSPMRGKLVTPRLQKRFINDIATTSLTMGANIDVVCIGAHLLLCKYDDLPLEEVIRADGFSASFMKTHEGFDDSDVSATKKLLGSHVGSELEDGWQIQFLQIHFLTNRKIAMAELIDEPLELSINEGDSERFAELISTFGFNDAFKRYLSNEIYSADLVRVLAAASEKLSKEDFESVIRLLNRETKTFESSLPENDVGFFIALKTCRLAGLNIATLDRVKSDLIKAVNLDVNEDVQAETLEVKRARLRDYDYLIDALGIEPVVLSARNAAYFTHVFSGCDNLTSVGANQFNFTQAGLKSIHEHIVALPDSTIVLPISEPQREILLEVLNSSVKHGHDPRVAMPEEDVLSLSKSLGTYPNHEAILFGMALSGKLPDAVVAQVASLTLDGATVSQKAAVAAILLNAKQLDALALIEDVNTVVDSKVFKLLFCGGGYSDVLSTEYLNPVIGKVISKVLAWAVKDAAIWTLNHSNISRNFMSVATATQPWGVESQALFEWIEGWQRHFKAETDAIDKLDEEFVNKLCSSDESQFEIFKKALLAFYGSDERRVDDWEPILLSESNNHARLLEWALKQEEFTLSSSYRSTTIEILKKIVVGHLDDDAQPQAVRSLRVIVAVSDQAQNNLLGAELRNILYIENGAPKASIWLLKELGHLIVDIQPASTAEVGKLMGILDYLNKHEEESQDALRYFEGRAKQIASYSYSEQLRDAMALAVSNLKKSAPNLYQAFAKKSLFKGILKDILSSEKKAEKAKSDLLKTEQKKAQEAPATPLVSEPISQEADETKSSDTSKA